MTACLGRLALIPPRGGRGEKDGGGYEGNEKGGGGGGASKRAAIAKSPRDKCQRPPSRVPEERPMLSAVAPVAQLRHGRRLAAAQARRPRNGQAATAPSWPKRGLPGGLSAVHISSKYPRHRSAKGIRYN
ncbi:unnamed protein product [Prorocentrum cordatum]|uniref:Uncharacterized protein n=1 Tax=Prorocentrum cordatum TaxID=2364126 RepID=A0ABN9Q8S6_9DINO|nr:unnamed protein product [Polarella glacialis]